MSSHNPILCTKVDMTIYLLHMKKKKTKKLRPKEGNGLSNIPSQLMDEEGFGKIRDIFPSYMFESGNKEIRNFP